MAKNKRKRVVNETQKIQMLEDVREVDQKLLDLMAKMYDAQRQTKALLDHRFEQIAEMLRAGAKDQRPSFDVSHPPPLQAYDKGILPNLKQHEAGVVACKIRKMICQETLHRR